MQTRFQGDPRITITANGADIVFYGGQPIMDKGLANAVIISLFTRPGWVGAKLKGCEGLRGSGFLAACEQSLTIATLNQIRQAAEKALNWINGTVEVSVRNPTGNKLEVAITIKPPGSTEKEVAAFLLSREGLHWYYQLLEG